MKTFLEKSVEMDYPECKIALSLKILIDFNMHRSSSKLNYDHKKNQGKISKDDWKQGISVFENILNGEKLTK